MTFKKTPDSDIDIYWQLKQEGKISKAEFDYIKKFDNEYYERKYFENPLNADYKQEDAARVYRRSDVLKMDTVQYNELVGYCLSVEEYNEVQEDLKTIGADGHIWKHMQIKKEMIMDDSSEKSIDKCLKDLVYTGINGNKV